MQKYIKFTYREFFTFLGLKTKNGIKNKETTDAQM